MKQFTEFDLAVACCRWPRTGEARARTAGLAAGVDWPLMRQVARRHRVEGLVWHALQDAGVEPPAEVAAALRAAARRIAQDNLRTAAECARLHRSFRTAGIEPLFLKGIALAQIAYGTISLKMGWDIDILVPPDAVAAATEVLSASGYRCTSPGSAVDLPDWHRDRKESVWQHDRQQLFVELHVRLFDNRSLMSDSGLAVRDVQVAPGIALPTLAEDRLFAYLCVHGATSAWFRLKWIADLAALLSQRSPAEITQLYRSAERLGLARPAAVALLLCEELFGIMLELALLEELRVPPMNRLLVRMSMKMMAGRGDARDPRQILLGTAPIHLMQFFLKRDWAFKKSELRRQLLSFRIRNALPQRDPD